MSNLGEGVFRTMALKKMDQLGLTEVTLDCFIHMLEKRAEVEE